jgi:glycosyltransferase involved in cell wall biosynthesis
MKKGISVLVCTFNGASRLPKTLEHLAHQTATSQISWEIIVVDNLSDDHSARVAEQEWKKHQLDLPNFRVLCEEKQGKIYALEQAVSTAQYEYCIICDDDNWLQSDYVLKMYERLESMPYVGAVGGQGIAVAQSGVLPDWFADFKDGYAVGKQAKQSGDVTLRGYLWGAGLGTRTLLYKQMYKNFPSLLTGRFGEQLTAGEDSEYCLRLILKGYKLYYDADLVFKHYIPDNRLTLEYKTRLFEGFTESNKVLSKYQIVDRMRHKYRENKLTAIYLNIITPVKIWLARDEAQKQKQREILSFISLSEDNPDSTISKIKRFCLDSSNLQ